MPATQLRDLVPVLQVATGPVILVSGVALLLLTMTNRIGRVIDRSRSLNRELREARPEDRPAIAEQLAILSRRARLLRRAITLGAIAVLLAAVLVIALFLTALFGMEDAALLAAIFVGCLSALIGSLIEFIRDLNQSLAALRLEIGGRE